LIFSQNLRQFFEEAFAFIDRARKANAGVLIHCHAGVSRSPTIAIAYLMKRAPMPMSEAYRFVKSRRSIISPNLNFMGQLWEFEQGLRTTNGTNLQDINCEDDDDRLRMEMREVRESIGGLLANPPTTPNGPGGFRWSEQSPGGEETAVATGCGV